MYQILKLEAELKELREACRRGEQTQAIVNRIFELELELDNIYYTEL